MRRSPNAKGNMAPSTTATASSPAVSDATATTLSARALDDVEKLALTHAWVTVAEEYAADAASLLVNHSKGWTLLKPSSVCSKAPQWRKRWSCAQSSQGHSL
ncbi:hypothetical protein PHYPSEUDO_013596 [Phytophthora pseudosyringae]|uniref:Uncharacterized protein n=1 Tax=Phytophthora pseudosyringae TaxID=221518 RepID=A0A8T1V5U8_9STRA|nr:hypothetical protein PHYPSEUDO_013596 [Phytophthora pseudosyringae]